MELFIFQLFSLPLFIFYIILLAFTFITFFTVIKLHNHLQLDTKNECSLKWCAHISKVKL